MTPIPTKPSPRHFASALCLALLTLTGTAATLHAQTKIGLRGLHNFGDANRGSNPMGALVQGPTGALYGTATYGGNAANSGGLIYRITRDGTYTVLSAPGLTDARADVTFTGGLTLASDGNFYGTTFGTGFGGGTVFRVTPAGVFTVLHSFSLNDGATPRAGLVQGPDGALYGTTSDGGANGLFHGTIYRITTAGAFKVLTPFDANTSACYAPLINGESGTFYGVTIGFGVNAGTIFRVTAAGALTTLHTFNANTDDGLLEPQAALIKAADGLYYGTCNGTNGTSGGIFSITSAGKYTTLYRFPVTGSGEVLTPAALIKGLDGAFYGTTFSGGSNNAGSVFRFAMVNGKAVVTTLYDFAGHPGVGANPNGPLLQTTSGDFYGVTNNGGAHGVGTIYTSEGASPGTVQFRATAYNTTESSGQVTLKVGRTSGNVGKATVHYATVRGTAVAGTDFAAAAGTLTWEDGDATDKTITVGIIDQGLVDAGTHTFSVVLSEATIASLGKAATATVNIALNDIARPTQPTVRLNNPPTGLQLLFGSNILLLADVTDPAGIVAKVEFFLNDVLYKGFGAGGPYAVTATDLSAGQYVVRVVVTDTFGRTREDSHSFAVLGDDVNNPTPDTFLFGDYNGRYFLGGSILFLSATADTFGFDASLLAQIAFYYNGILIAAYDGAGNLLPGGLAGLDQFSNGIFGDVRLGRDGGLATLYGARFRVPSVDGSVDLTTVVTSRTGISRISGVVSFGSTISVPAGGVTGAGIGGIADGTVLPLGTPFSFSVDVTGTAKLVEYYLNGAKIGESATAPYGFQVSTPASGTYRLSAIVTDVNGLATVTDPVSVQVTAPTPTVSFVVPGAPEGGHAVTVAEGGQTLKVRVFRSGDDLSQALVVYYKVKGDAVEGRDFGALTRSVTIPAGLRKAKVKVTFPGDDVQDGTRVLKLKLRPSANGEYELGTTHTAKITILDVN